MHGNRPDAVPNAALTIFFAVALSLLYVSSSLADRVRCPVCDQTFPEEVQVCPNDGTNLKLLGKPAPDTEEPTSPEETDEEATSEKKGETNAAAKDGKYVRHDRGGTRKRTEEEEDDSPAYKDRTDRTRRIGDERGDETAAEKRRREKRRRAEYRKRDRELREQFYRDREKMLAGRAAREADEALAKDGYDVLRQRKLWAQGAPFTAIGIRVGWMGEGDHPGPVTGAEVDFNLVKTEIRVGLSTFLGVRALESRGDLVLLESVSLGFQMPWRFSPFVLVRAGIGILVSNRFGTDITQMMRSIGLETGVDCRVAESLVVTPSVGYAGYAVNDAYWNSVTLKLSLGF